MLEKIINSARKTGKFITLKALPLFAAGAVAFLPMNVSRADTHYVATNGLHNSPYTSWVDASTNIQAAVDVASGGDEVRIGNGTYSVPVTNGVSWNAASKHLTIKSENGPENCVMDCQTKGRGFTLTSGQNTNDVISGITVKNGKSLIPYLAISEYYGGGAILISGGSPIIENCYLLNNQAKQSPGSSSYADGGAIDMISNSVPTIRNCVIVSNTATHTGGGIHVHGSSPKIENNIIMFNHNGGCYGGGGIGYTYNSSGTVKNNLIVSNTAHYYNIKGGFGAGIEMMNSNPTIENNTIVGNDTRLNRDPLKPGEGGGIRIRGLPAATLRNNIIWGNIGTNGLENLDCQYPTYTINLENSCLGPGSTNFICPKRESNLWNTDPMFVNTNTMDYQLDKDSPCVNAGSNQTWMTTAFDFDKTNRILYGTVDIGAYEKIMPFVEITTLPTTNGTIVPAGTLYVPYRFGNTNLQVSADEGYHIAGLSTNGNVFYTNSASRGITSTNISLSNLRANTSVGTSFDINKYLANVVSAYGTPNPGTTNVDHGTVLNQTVEPYVNIYDKKRVRLSGYNVTGVSATENP